MLAHMATVSRVTDILNSLLHVQYGMPSATDFVPSQETFTQDMNDHKSCQ